MSLAERPVEVVIACHNHKRAIKRAVASVVEGNRMHARAIVVCHNADPALIRRATGNYAAHPLVRFLELDDGIPSPAGPFNFGIDRATASWVSIMGSDDHLQPGAVKAWLALATGRTCRGGQMDAVVPRLLWSGGSTVATPPVRPFKTRRRDAVKDRLFYRSAPLGLLHRGFLDQRGIELVGGLPVGEDLAFSAQVWMEARVAVQRRGPGYVIGDDAADRVTMRRASAAEELAHLDSVWRSRWLEEASPEVRRALGIKYLRIHLFGFAYYRAAEQQWSREDREVLRDCALQILESAPGCEAPLSIADRSLLAAILDLDRPSEDLTRLALARRRFRSPATWIPSSRAAILDREAPLRMMTASALTKLVGDV